MSKQKIILQDRDEVFTMEQDLRDNLNILRDVHKGSTIYNNKAIRLDGVGEKNGIITLATSRTTYFDFCASNRMIDYVKKNKRTIRDDLLYDPLFPRLEDSGLSNLLGFNCMIVSSDGYLIFVKRGSNVSIEKGKLGVGIQASVKYMYTHEKKGQKKISIEDIYNSVYYELKDELGVSLNDKTQIGSCFWDIYYDYVEAKPQLYFEIQLSDKDCRSSLQEIQEYVSKKDASMIKDGNSVVAIPVKEAQNIYISSFAIAYKNKYYSMVPSASYCVARFLENQRRRDVDYTIIEEYTKTKEYCKTKKHVVSKKCETKGRFGISRKYSKTKKHSDSKKYRVTKKFRKRRSRK